MSAIAKKILEVHFYATASGKEPVREWLLDLSVRDRNKIGRDVLAVQYGWPIGMPLVKSLGKGLKDIDLTEKRMKEYMKVMKGKK